MAGGNSRQQIEEALGLKDAYSSLKQIEAVIPQILDGFKNIATTSKDISTSLGGKNTLKEIVQMSKLSAQQAKAYADEQKALLDVESRIIQQLEKEAKTRKAETDAITAQTKASKEATNALIAEERAKQSMLRTEQMANKAKEASTKLTGEAARIAKLQEQLNSSLEGSYNRLNAQYQLNVIELNKMTIEQRENTDAGKLLTKQTAELYAQLGKLDESTGRHQRSVGNYAKAFNGLQFQMQQIAREAPSLAYGPQMFIAAISNNLPMLQDEIAKTRLENEKLRASGEKAIPVWRQMGAALLSPQTAAVALITTYMLFSKEINAAVIGLFRGRQALNETKIVTEDLTAAKIEGIKAAQDELTTIKLLYNASQDETLSRKERLAAIDEMQKKYPSYLGRLSDEEILAGKAQKAYYELANAILAAAMAQARRDKIAENSKKILEFEEQLAKAQEAQYVGLSKVEQAEKRRTAAFSLKSFIAKQGEIYGASSAFEVYSDKVRDAQDNIAALVKSNEELSKGIKPTDLLFESNKTKTKEQKTNEPTDLENLQARHKQEIELEKQYQQESLDLFDGNEIQRTEIIKANTLDILEIRRDQIDEELKLVKKGSEDYNKLLVERAKVETSIKTETTKYNQKIRELQAQKEEEDQKRWADQEKKAYEDSNKLSKERVDAIEAEVDIRQLSLQEGAIQQIITAKNNKDEILRIEHELTQGILKEERDRLQAALDRGEIVGDVAEQVRKRIREINIQLSKDEIDYNTQTTERTTEKKKEQLQAYGELANNSFDLIKGLYDAEANAAQEAYNKEMQAAGDNVEEKILAERKFQKENRRIKREQAIMDKAQALFNIGLNLAMALSTPNLIAKPILVAAASVAMASVLARPIPQYAKGTKNAPSTFIAGEEGTEAIVKPSGETILTPDKATLFSDKSFVGSTILPHDRTLKMLQNYSIKHDKGVMIDMSKTNKHLETIARNTQGATERFIDARGNLVVKRGNITTHYASRTI